MMRKRLVCLSFAAALGWTQPVITSPQIGFVQDAANSLRPVYGISGNFLLGDSVAERVSSSAFSGSFGFVKTDSSLAVIDSQGKVLVRGDVPAGPALFAFSRVGAPAFVFLPDSGALLSWSAGGFETVPVHFEGVAVSIVAYNSGEAGFIVRRDGDLWLLRVSPDTGGVISQTGLPGVRAPLLALPDGDLICGDSASIVIRKLSGSEKHLEVLLPDAFAFQQMGEGWVQLRDLSSGRQVAIRVTENREEIYGIPEGKE